MDLEALKQALTGEVTVIVREIKGQSSMKSKFGNKEDIPIIDLVVSDHTDTRQISVSDPTFTPQVGDKVRLIMKIKKSGNTEYWNGSKMRKIFDEDTQINQIRKEASKEAEQELMREQVNLLRVIAEHLTGKKVNQTPNPNLMEIGAKLLAFANELEEPSKREEIQKKLIELGEKLIE